MNNKFQNFLQNEIIISQKSSIDTLKNNGVYKKENQHLQLECDLNLLLNASLSYHFWVECLCVIFYLINHLPSLVVNEHSPYFCLYKKIDHTWLFIFEYLCYTHLPSLDRNKLNVQSARCMCTSWMCS